MAHATGGTRSFVLFLLALHPFVACDDGGDGGFCGNGVLETGETCDGTALGDASCEQLGYAGGVLGCTIGCTLNASTCLSSVCGNGIVEGDEQCDGDALTGTCQDRGFEQGTVQCSQACRVDTSQCRISVRCGNGTLNLSEECEGDDLGEHSCASQGFSGGEAVCDDLCQLDLVGCTRESLCGNGQIDDREFCDGLALGGMTCEGIGFPQGGALACAADCTFDVSGCVAQCPWDAREWGEQCQPGVTVCCAEDNRAVGCVLHSPVYGDFCWYKCTETFECGLNLQCYRDGAATQGYCYTAYCNQAYSSCTHNDGIAGTCVPVWLASDINLFCAEDGFRRQGQSCDPTVEGGQLAYDAMDLCLGGLCHADPAAPEVGTCLEYCDAPRIFEGTKDDTCPQFHNCLNQSDFYHEGAPYYMNDGFRTTELGVCYPMYDGQNAIIARGHLACHLLTNVQTKSGLPCPDDKACLPFLRGSLQGVCRPIAATPDAPGTPCDPTAEISSCDAASACVMSDPFHETNLADPAFACRRKCDAGVFEANEACDGLPDGPFVCLSTSRFHTSNHELPTYGGQTETRPSRQGFCVPNR